MRTIAVVGAGAELASDVVDLLIERGVDEADIAVFDDERTAGERIEIGSLKTRVEPVTPTALGSVDAAVFCDDGRLAHRFVSVVARGGGLVIDASPVSRRAPDARLIVPEVNGATLSQLAAGTILASPMPATVALVTALAPLRAAIGIGRVVTTLLAPASQRGEDAVEELSRQSVWLMQGRGLGRRSEAERLAFNLRPSAASEEGDGWAASEHALAAELRAVFGEPRLDVIATEVRAPVFYGAAQSVVVDLDRAATVDELAELLRQAPGLLVAGSPEHDAWLALAAEDEPESAGDDQGEEESDDEADESYDDGGDGDGGAEGEFGASRFGRDAGLGGEVGSVAGAAMRDLLPGPVDVSGSDLVHVARLRVVPGRPDTVAFWLSFDDVRKGVAVNAVATLQLALASLA